VWLVRLTCARAKGVGLSVRGRKGSGMGQWMMKVVDVSLGPRTRADTTAASSPPLLLR
jgi:hypothetical protein